MLSKCSVQGGGARVLRSHCSSGSMMSEREKFVLKGGILSDVIHKTFTRTIMNSNVCQLQLGHHSLFIEGGEQETDLLFPSIF